MKRRTERPGGTGQRIKATPSRVPCPPPPPPAGQPCCCHKGTPPKETPTVTAPRTIYSPTDWPDLHTDPRHDTLLAWLRLNGINPNDLPPNQIITIDGGLIRYVVFAGDDRGRKIVHNDDVVLEGRTTRCTVDPPHELTGT